MLLGLDRAGIAVHSGSACSSESLEPSPVLVAMGAEANQSLRVSVGWSTTDGDVAAFAQVFPAVVGELPRPALSRSAIPSPGVSRPAPRPARVGRARRTPDG